MSDSQGKTLTLSAVTGATTLRDTPFSTEGIRSPVFSVEISAKGSSNAGDTLIVTIQHTNADAGTYGTTDDTYWSTYLTMTTIQASTVTPVPGYIEHKNDTDSGSSNTPKPFGKNMRIKYVTADASGTGSWTGKVRIAWNNAVTQ